MKAINTQTVKTFECAYSDLCNLQEELTSLDAHSAKANPQRVLNSLGSIMPALYCFLQDNGVEPYEGYVNHAEPQEK